MGVAGRFLVIGIVAIGVFWANPSDADSVDIEPAWGPVSALDARDRAIAEQVIEENLEGLPPADAAWRRDEARAALFALPGSDGLLLVEAAQDGNCGDYELYIFGPADRAERRAKLEQKCTDRDFRLRSSPGLGMPDLVLRPSDLITHLFRWNGNGWNSEPEVAEDFSSAANQIGVNWRESGKYSHLLKYAGTYDLVSVLREPAIYERLKAGFGERYLTFLSNLAVRGPWDYVEGCLTVHGNRAHRGMDESAILAVCLYGGDIHAAIFDRGAVTLLSAAEEYRYIPGLVRAFVEGIRLADKPPRGVVWIH